MDAERLSLLRSRLGEERYAAAGARSRGMSSAAAVAYARSALRRGD